MDQQPIAIVGVGVRLPGGIVDRPSAWRFFVEGRDAVGEVPQDRWDPATLGTPSGRPVPQHGAFLASVDRFDPHPFGIAPREGRSMDPQQRLLLEVALEAFEDAGISPRDRSGSTGVFVGMGLVDWGRRTFGAPDAVLDAWSGTGVFDSVAAGRISYVFGLHGPSLAVHTACSSSLVAIHLACRAIAAGECDQALAGGVNLLLAPEPTQYFAELGALSISGRCRTFDAAADGYVRGEGAGLFVLKPLDAALAASDRILAVIRGTAVNQDGRSNGLTAPSGQAQRAVIRRALAAADLPPRAVGYVEAHGTGTPLGDPVEMGALSAVFGAGAPLPVGSGKTQLGHLEAAAGVAGLLRGIGAVRHGVVPPHLHLSTVNPRIDLRHNRLVIPTAALAWDAEVRVAGISGFGLSGTNAHVVITEPPPTVRASVAVGGPWLVATSAHDPAALTARWGQLRTLDGPPEAIARAAAEGRAGMRTRAAVLWDGAGDLPDLGVPLRPTPPGGVVFAFTGQGSQTPGMGAALYASEAAYRDAVDAVDAVYRRHTGRALLPILHEAPEDVLGTTGWTQPALFAMEWGLAALWRHLGLVPDAVLGHSVGEIVAAAVAGVMSLEDAVVLVAERADRLQALPPGGAMAAVALGGMAVTEGIEAVEGVAIAAINGPDETVISGDAEGVRHLVRRWASEGIRVTPLDVSHAFHSPRMGDAVAGLVEVARGLSLSAPTLPLFSCVSGGLVGPEIEMPDHWGRHIVAPVRFADAVGAAFDHGHDTFVEIGPRPVLVALGGRVVPEAAWLGALHPDQPDRERILETIRGLYLRGVDVSWRAVHAGARWPDAPPYPFQRVRSWIDSAGASPHAMTVPQYRTAWEPRPVVEGDVVGQRWTLLGNPEGIGGALQRGFAEAGAQARCSPALADGPQHVVWFLQAAEDPDLAEALAEAAALLRDDRVRRLWAVVRATSDDPLAAALAGLGATAAVEVGDRWGGMLRVAPHLDAPDAAAAIYRSVSCGDGEDLVVIGRHGRSVPRLAPVIRPPVPPPTLDPDATYLITGGLGTLGRGIAGLLVDLGARHLILVTRSGAPADPADPIAADLADLRGRGAEVACPAVDVADASAMRALLNDVDPPLAGIVHAAGIARGIPLVDLSSDDVAAHIAGKATGARVLDALAPDVDFFVLISSIAAMWGSAGLSAYGAANRTLHALARRRRRAGKAGTALALGPLSAGGLVDPASLEAFRRMGVTPLSTEALLGALSALLRREVEPELVLAEVDWATFAAILEVRRRRPLLDRVRPTTAPVRGGATFADELSGTPADLRRDRVVAKIGAEVARVIGVDGGIDPAQGFFDLGLDSAMAVDLAGRLRRLTGLPLDATVAFDHPTVEALASHVLESLGLTAVIAATAVRTAHDEPIAIVGLACRLPGASDPEAFWRLLVDGTDAIAPVPADRWDPVAWPEAPRRGGFLDDVAGFDPGAFGLSPDEITAMDPQQRLLLEVAVEAVEGAGLVLDRGRGTRGAVFVGVGRSEYWPRLQQTDDTDEAVDRVYPWSGTGNASSFAAGRLAWHFGLTGPAMTIDTACSSSLVAVHLAAQALQRGEASFALAGGAQVILSPEAGGYLKRIGALSPTDRCLSFDAAADGYVRGEGCGVVVLKRLSDAERDGDRIWAILPGSAVGHDGHSSGLTVPRGQAQQDVIRGALHAARLQPGDVAAIEAHGTGTPLGDPIEIGALKTVFGGSDRPRPLMVASVKAAIGHLEAAAGITSLIKAVLMVQHRRIPPTAHLDRLNPALPVDFSVHFPTTVEGWPGGDVVGVSSFGISGTNAHVLVAAPPAAPTAEVEDPASGWPLLLVSGHTEAALQTQLQQVRGALKDHDIDAIASTLAHGRAPRRHRVAVVGRGRDVLRRGLRDPIHVGEVDPSATVGIGFLFTGQGSQRVAMAGPLAAADPRFRQALSEAVAAVPPEILDPRELERVLLEDDDRIHDTRFTQPALVALQWALAMRWRALGVRPTVVLGHSVGEISAAAVSGALTLGGAMVLAATRGAAMADLPPGGAMAAVRMSASDLDPWIRAHPQVALAAVNAVDEVVISGPGDAVAALSRELVADGITVDPLTVSTGFHSALVEPALPALRAVGARLESAAPQVLWFSNVDGKALSAPPADHWVRHARAPVRFLDGMRAAAAHCRVWVELGPRGVLSALGGRSLPDVRFLPSMQQGSDPVQTLAAAAGALWVAGQDLDPAGWIPRRAPIALPPTPLFRTPQWIAAPDAAGASRSTPRLTFRWTPVPADHPFEAGASAVVLSSNPVGPALDVLRQLEALGVSARGSLLDAPPEPGCGHVFVLALDAPDPPADAVAFVIRILQRLIATPAPRPRVWWLTRGAVSVGQAEAVDAGQRGVWGLIATAALEHPDLACTLVDLDPDDDARGLDVGLAAGGDRIAIRGGRAFVPHLAPMAPTSADPPVIRGDRSYLVTGAAGGIGRHLVSWLLDQGAGRVWQVGRRAPDDPDPAVDASRCAFLPADVGDRAGVASVLDQIRSGGAPLAGVFHLAGEAPDGLLRGVQDDDIARAFRGKVAGAVHLHELTHGLDLFVLFSSAIGWLGLPGLGVYGAANAALDGLAEHRVARGQPATSVAFGPWQDLGMASALDPRGWIDEGVVPLDPDQALAGMAEGIASGIPTLAVFRADWSRLSRRHVDGPPAWIRGLPGVSSRAAAAGASSLVHRLGLARSRDRAGLLQAQIGGLADEIVGGAPLGRRQGFFEAGMDSLMAVELVRRLGRRLDRTLAPTVAFDHPNIEALAAHLLGVLDLAPIPEAPLRVVSTVRDAPIAIVGMGCRIPGASDPEALWSLIVSGERPLREVPRSRWDVDAWYAPPPGRPGRIYARTGGFLDAIDRFDPEFFGISPREAASLDPQQRLLLEICWEALEGSGHAVPSLRGSATGVFVGITHRGYLQRFQRPDRPLYPDPWAGTGTDPSFAPGRVAHALGLQGPVVALDTTCSSSLVAVHLAAAALRNGECDMALAGGVSLQLLADDTAYLCALGALSPTGRCHTFDAAADGYVRSEGGGIVVLKPLDRAEADGDTVLAVIRGSAVNHDGASSGLTVPNGAAQQAVLREALRRADAVGADVGYLETHGTGTRLGDPIEVHAAQAVYGDRQGRGPLLLGALKAQVGHLELAAGVAALIKTIQVLRHRRVPAQPLTTLNPAIDLQGARIPQDPEGWPEGTRLAAVSAFGLSGTNASILIEAGPRPAMASSDPVPQPRPLHVVGLSARSEGSLAALAAGLPRGLPLPDVAAAVHRRIPMEIRRAVVAADVEAAASALAEGSGVQVSDPPRVALLFSGQGCQVPGQAIRLAEAFPPFADHLAESAAILDPVLGRPLAEILADPEALADTAWLQPVLAVIHTGLPRLLGVWGVPIDVVVGHSLGELSAAAVAGVLSLDDALRLAAARGAAMARMPPGAMIAVVADSASFTVPAGLSVAAVNAVDEIVLGGPPGAVDAAEAALVAAGIAVRRLATDRAFHTAAVDGVLDPLRAALERVTLSPPEVPLISLCTGAVEDAALTDPAFWLRHAREPVQAAAGLSTLAALGANVLVDLGGRPVLSGLAERVPALASARRVPTLPRGTDDAARGLCEAVARLFEAGVDIDWTAWDAPWPRERVAVPTYPFDRRRFWLEETTPAASDWTYGVAWVPGTEAVAPTPVVVVGPEAEVWVAALIAAGHPATASTVEAVAADAFVVDLRWISTPVLEEAVVGGVGLVRRVDRGRVCIVTRGGVARGDEDVDPSAAGLWGLVRSLGLEVPDRAPRIVDVEVPADLAVGLRSGARQVAVRSGAAWVPRLERVDRGDDAFAPSGCWWITGGLGALGLAVAGWLAGRGVTSLVLTSRTALPDADSVAAAADPQVAHRVAEVAALQAMGVSVTVAPVDAADAEAMGGLLAAHPPDGVVHAAGVTLPRSLAQTTAPDVATTLRGKVTGAQVLDELLADRPLQGFVLFSSVAATWGSQSLLAYAAANAYLDGLAAHRQHRGQVATAVAWGPWSGGGMVDAERGASLERAGLRLLPVAGALQALGSAMGSSQPHTVVARVDWPRFVAAMEARAPRPFFAAFRPPAVALAPVETAVVPSGIGGELAPDAPTDVLREHLTARVRGVLGVSEDRSLPPDQPLADRGFDSLMATELKATLLADGLDVPLGRLLGGPSIDELVVMVQARRSAAAVAPTAEGGVPMRVLAWTHLAAAIVGIALASAVWGLL